MSAPREALLDRIIEHVAAHGLSDVSLRELAEAIGTSHRMLLYHFGSREGVVAAIVGAIEQQQRVALADIAERSTSPSEVVTTQWAQLADPAMAPFVRLFYEVAAHAMFGRPGTAGFIDDLIDPWLDAADAAAERLGVEVSRTDTRLGIAVLRGLLLDAVATGDPTGATEALERFVALWEQGGAS